MRDAEGADRPGARRRSSRPNAPTICRRPPSCAMARCASWRTSWPRPKNGVRQLQAKGALLKEEVDAEEIAAVVSKWTGIPVSKLLEGEREKLIRMEEVLHERVVGQEEAVQRRGRGDSPQPRRAARPQPADRQLHLPGADRRGQDRAGARAGRVPVRRRAEHGAHRHERVPGAPHRGPADRRAARLCGLRRRRPA